MTTTRNHTACLRTQLPKKGKPEMRQTETTMIPPAQRKLPQRRRAPKAGPSHHKLNPTTRKNQPLTRATATRLRLRTTCLIQQRGENQKPNPNYSNRNRRNQSHRHVPLLWREGSTTNDEPHRKTQNATTKNVEPTAKQPDRK